MQFFTYTRTIRIEMVVNFSFSHSGCRDLLQQCEIIGYVAILLITHTHALGLIGGLIIISQLFQFLMMSFLQSSRRVTGQAVSVIAQSLSHLAVLCTLIFFLKGKETAALWAVLSGYIVCIPVLLFQTGIMPRRKSTSNNLAAGDIFRKLLSYGMPMCIWFFATNFTQLEIA